MPENTALVIDASVIIKWVLQDPVREDDTLSATELMRAIVDNRVAVHQPTHWLVEVAAVLTRLTPTTAPDDVRLLHAMEFPTTDTTLTMQRACSLAIDLKALVFDTLYHAVALESSNGYLVTADKIYLARARHVGHVVGLLEWQQILH